MMKNKKNNIPTIIFICAVSIGLLIMLYPVFLNFFNAQKEARIIANYSDRVKELRETNYEYLFEEARKYNQTLTNENIIDAFTEKKETSEEYARLLNINNDGVLGYLKIPKIDVNLPIYHGTSTKVLEKGIGHMEASSLPIGGAGTHAILSGHRGLPSSRLFSDLNQLEKGDTFYIHILNQVFAYEVDQISVVEPSDIEQLKISDKEDYVTLVTCTPYAINTHRLLVRGTRIEYKAIEENNIHGKKKLSASDLTLIGGLITVVVIITACFFIIYKIKRHQPTKDEIAKYKLNKAQKSARKLANKSKKLKDIDIAFPKMKDK